MNRQTQAQHGHGRMPPPPHHALARYGSAPGSFLAAVSDIVHGGGDAPPRSQQQQPGQAAVSRFFSGESSGLTSCESSCRTDAVPRLQRAYGGSGEIHVPPPAHAPPQQGLLRHSSSPAGLLSRLMADPHGNGGMAGTSGAVMGSYSPGAGGNGEAMAQQQRGLSSQWSFSRQDMMPHISEMGMGMPGSAADIGESIGTGGNNCSSDLSRSFSMGSWDDANSIMFSSPGKKAKVLGDGDDGMFGLSSSSLEMTGMDEYMQLQQDSVACRARAKRGCATHPRSIAERERRTRISKRLRKLQDLVPNMDKFLLDYAANKYFRHVGHCCRLHQSATRPNRETKTGPRKLLLLNQTGVMRLEADLRSYVCTNVIGKPKFCFWRLSCKCPS